MAYDRGYDGPPRPERVDKRAPPPRSSVVQQYRERHNMTYELECGDARLILRMFFPPEDAPVVWRIEARTTDAADAYVVGASGESRASALAAVSEAWAAGLSAPSLDWPAVTLAMQGVRAI